MRDGSELLPATSKTQDDSRTGKDGKYRHARWPWSMNYRRSKVLEGKAECSLLESRPGHSLRIHVSRQCEQNTGAPGHHLSRGQILQDTDDHNSKAVFAMAAHFLTL